MRFKEYKRWCYKQMFEGRWIYNTNASNVLINILLDINSKPFWKREKEWSKVKPFVLRVLKSKKQEVLK